MSMRQELNRVKEAHSKERMARLSMQQESNMLKEQIMRLEKLNEGNSSTKAFCLSLLSFPSGLANENKVIPGLIESNEILKNDLSQLRKRHKEDRISAQKQIQLYESQVRDVDGIKNDVRALALRLLDISSNGNMNNPTNNNNGSGNNNNGSGFPTGGSRMTDSVASTSMQSLILQQQQMQQQQQQQQGQLSMSPDNYRRFQQQQQQVD